MKTIIIKNIPEDVYRLFKTKCAEKEISIKDAIIELMEKFVDKKEGKK